MKQVAGQVGVNRPADSINARHAQEFPEPLSAGGRAPEAAQRRQHSMRRANSWKSLLSEPDGTSDPMGSMGTSPALSMSTPNVLGAPDLPVRALDAARTAHTLSPNLSAECVGVQSPRVGHDPPCGFLTAGSILSRLDRRLPLGVSRGW